ncbi:MAG: tRNA (adenosine(37)-N6)-threonylcarbamoyltransferase complex dimerization subunit type 1 TsaB [Synergistaceae bacterium]|nr:tRNA (adenosine(37)-N6)-threonylcarbamoyltransferase complex dimerization subunit type 1 TsaB [Synergistaceae bacterium]
MRDILLAIDCSLRYTGIAVAMEINENFKMLSELNADIGLKQATELPALALKTIKDSGIKIKEITHVAVTNGPGYFTGVRIGMSWSAAFAFGIGASIVPVGTLEAIVLSDDNVIPSIFLIYAGRNSVYAITKGFPADLTAAEYSLDYIAQWAAIYKDMDFRIFVDNIQKIIIPSLPNLQTVTPKVSNVVEIAWNKRESFSISPFELKANWCRSPV